MKKKSKLQVSMSCLLSAALLTTTPFMTGAAVYGQEMEEEFVSELETGNAQEENNFSDSSISTDITNTDEAKVNDSNSNDGSEPDDISISDTQEEPDIDSKNKDVIEEDSNKADSSEETLTEPDSFSTEEMPEDQTDSLNLESDDPEAVEDGESLDSGDAAAGYAYSDHGVCGSNARWTWKNGILRISGTGTVSGDPEHPCRIMDSEGNYVGIDHYGWGSTASGDGAKVYSIHSDTTSIIIEEGITGIEKSVFTSFDELTSISLPESMQVVGEGAFNNCPQLSSVKIPGGVREIGYSAFRDCSMLSSIWISDNVQIIGNDAFRRAGYETSNCTVVLGSGITSIGENSFSYSTIKEINIPNSVKTIGAEAFRGCGKLEKVTMTDSVTEIGASAFASCENLVNIRLSESITAIPESMMWCCEKITSITLPSKIKSIGKAAFCHCENLTEITIPSGVTEIGETAFASTKIKSLVIPNKVKVIGEGAFEFCKQLEKITFPAGITDIKAAAFDGCDKLKHVYYYGTPKKWETVKIYIWNYELRNYPKMHYMSATMPVSGITYSGAAKKPAITVKDPAGKVVSSKYYTVTWKNNKNVGTASATITFKGIYTGTIQKTFKILPKATALSGVSALSKGFKASWKAQTSQATGYQVQYSTNKSFKGPVTKTVTSYKTKTLTVKKLSAGKRYYVRIRTYRTVGGQKYYSAWSTAKAVTTKK